VASTAAALANVRSPIVLLKPKKPNRWDRFTTGLPTLPFFVVMTTTPLTRGRRRSTRQTPLEHLDPVDVRRIEVGDPVHLRILV
jgi:hypothetical protein